MRYSKGQNVLLGTEELTDSQCYIGFCPLFQEDVLDKEFVKRNV